MGNGRLTGGAYGLEDRLFRRAPAGRVAGRLRVRSAAAPDTRTRPAAAGAPPPLWRGAEPAVALSRPRRALRARQQRPRPPGDDLSSSRRAHRRGPLVRLRPGEYERLHPLSRHTPTGAEKAL